MAIAIKATGTVTTDGTTQTINSGSFTDSGTYVLTLNLTNLANGDEIEVVAKTKVVTAGSEAVYATYRFFNAQGPKVWQTTPVLSPYSMSFTIKEIAGSHRDYEWSVLSV